MENKYLEKRSIALTEFEDFQEKITLCSFYSSLFIQIYCLGYKQKIYS
ncbi:hypothetical protein H1P_1560011 [Hyella patelloides LEGE 07179]|uniref:Uncharacterized protein n=1 Tax=Hyella patelloides LEGE 07179 TaxID=945734 RepID=A0A563VMG9_9CYAN|nr:hypothetical protein H1P_1560011 [Hyella patelloides LEGE 07179]